MKSDILRYEILYKYGGVYIDTDYECVTNIGKYGLFYFVSALILIVLIIV